MDCTYNVIYQLIVNPFIGDVNDDLMVTFEVSIEEYDKVTTRELVANGKDKPVTNDNRDEFVKLYLEWLLNTSIDERFRAFYLGFHSVCASNALIMLRPEEVEQLVCGCPTLDLGELRKVTYYDGYKQDDKTVEYFWQAS
jgi:E3 ubiquitin-protein ligase HECTD2